MTTPKGVVRDDRPAQANIVRRPFEVFVITPLVGVDEHQIVGSIRRQLWQHLQARALQNRRSVRQPGVFKVGARYLGVEAAHFDGDELAVGGQGASDADAAVAGKGADFDDALGAAEPHQQLQQLGFIRLQVDLREAARGCLPPHVTQRIVFAHEEFVDISIAAL